ncbi:depolymerase [Peredibacter sp. HCB2-198]|uniref:extracellular catalytic domain type 2 short-chain-length polyhydroxyalkanoate depolymerase n=1 Tax=Peredibacter sp. HCB2-198 TaxID=3383025 RepID=UPI0038B5182B
MKWLLTLTLFPLTTFASSKITVSGISSGAYMAQQFHTAYSSEVSGVGIVAGGPYYCAGGQAMLAMGRCMKTNMGSPIAEQSVYASKILAMNGLIDPVQNIASSRVYIFSGRNDDTVYPKVVDATVETYRLWGVHPRNIRYENKSNAGHTFPTVGFGNPCETPGQIPFISKCGKDVAGEILNHLLGPLHRKVTPRSNRFFTVNQLAGMYPAEVAIANMGQKAFAYVPDGCEYPDANGCAVHVAFHGCKQTLDDIKTTFIKETGYNAWAESNRIVVIYPQAKTNPVTNPNGCWDWWGYSGPYYHTQQGVQLKQVYKMIKNIKEGRLKLEPVKI